VKRREVLTLLGSAAAAWPLAARAQPAMPVMGYVAAKNVNPERLAIFKKGLTDFGYVEGKNIRIEYRDAVLDTEYHGVMADLANRKVNIIVAANVAAAVAAAKATNTIPVRDVGGQ
jgi:putative tryptophan/tyrosine transport system substrate-binding protein